MVLVWRFLLSATLKIHKRVTIYPKSRSALVLQPPSLRSGACAAALHSSRFTKEYSITTGHLLPLLPELFPILFGQTRHQIHLFYFILFFAVVFHFMQTSFSFVIYLFYSKSLNSTKPEA